MLERLAISMRRRWQTLALGSALVACDELPRERAAPPDLAGCVVVWSGTLPGDAGAFDVRACWESGCTSRIRVEVAPEDAGAAGYADCVPTTPGGPPSRCSFTPPPGCGFGETRGGIHVQACAGAGPDGTDLSVALSTGANAGGLTELTIETVDADLLVESRARVPSDGSSAGSCQDARFDLSGTPIAE